MHQVAEELDGAQGRSLLARAGGHLCAIPLAGVAEVMRALPIHRVGGAPPFIAGLAVVRGAPVPVVDLAALLATPSPGPAQAPGGTARLFVTLRVERGSGGERQLVALLVAGVLGLRTLDPAQRAASPPLVERLAGEVIAAVTRLDAQLVMVLRTARLVPEPVWASLDAARAATGAAAHAAAAASAPPVERP